MQGRIRTIKPDFFQHEGLSTLAHGDRLLFAGLWCYADREGRLRDDPTLLKALIFPRERYDVDAALSRLAPHVVRYEVGGKRYLWIRGFTEHQRPGNREAASAIPECPDTLKHAQAPHEHAEGEWEGNGKGREGRDARRDRTAADLEDAQALVGLVNDLAGTHFDAGPTSTAVREAVARLGEHGPYLLEQVVRWRWATWGADQKMRPFFRPKTLFAKSNCEDYVGQLPPAYRNAAARNQAAQEGQHAAGTA